MYRSSPKIQRDRDYFYKTELLHYYILHYYREQLLIKKTTIIIFDERV